MSNQANDGSKLQELIWKFGGWAVLALISVVGVMYTNDRQNTANELATLEKSITATQRAISRLQEGKVSREEFRSVQEQWIRETQGMRQETQGMRQDIRELTSALRIDIKGAIKKNE